LNDRIRKLRKALDLTQKEFANRIGIKQNTVATYEIGRSEPIDAVIALICREFNVREEWLRAGIGEMFKETEETAVSRLCDELHATPLEAGIIRAYFRIDPDIRDTFMRRLMEEVQSEYGITHPAPVEEPPTAQIVPPGYSSREELEAEARAEAERYYEQVLSEKRQALQASSANESGAG